MPQLPPAIASYIATIMPKMNGWCSPDKAESLARHAIAKRPSFCLEIGVYAGRSIFAIALALLHNRHGSVIGIDPWEVQASVAGFESDPANRDWWAKLDHGAIYAECDSHLKKLGLEDVCALFCGTSAQALPLLKLASSNAPFLDLLHIDGNHSVESALFDVDGYVPLVRPEGTVYFDDLDWSTTKKAQERLEHYCELVDMVGNCGIYTRKP